MPILDCLKTEHYASSQAREFYLKVDSTLIVDAKPDEGLIFAVGGVVIVVVGGVRAQVGVLFAVERLRMEKNNEGRDKEEAEKETESEWDYPGRRETNPSW